MEVQLFPFGAVPPRARIIIYGFGDVGRQYLLQIKKTVYCEVEAVIDCDYEVLDTESFRVRSPEYLYEMSSDKYDYVIVAISHPEMAQNIGRHLVQNGVDNRKLVYPLNPSFLIDADLMKPIKDYAKSLPLDEWPNFFPKYVAYSKKQYPDRLSDLMEAVRSNITVRGRENVLDWCKRRMFSAMDDDSRLVFLRWLYDLRCFDADCMRCFIATLRDMEWRKEDDTPYVGIIESELPMTFQCPEIAYQSFYQERQNLFHRIIEHYGLQLSSPSISDDRQKKRIAFVVCTVANPINTQIYCQFINGFTVRGYEVRLIVLGAFDKLDDSRVHFQPLYVNGKPDHFERSIMGMFTDKKHTSACYIEDASAKGRMQKAIDEICDYDPYFVIDMADDVFPEGYLIQQRYPIIFKPLRGFEASAFCDAYITNNKAEVLRRGVIPESKIVELRLGVTPMPFDGTVYEREQFGWAPDDFLMITVGHRLADEVTEDMIERVCDIMEADLRIRWILVEGYGGRPKPDLERFTRLVQDGRIVFWGYESHILSLFKICDVLLNPKRQGGAVSIRQAMILGIPVAMTDVPSDNLARMAGHVVHGGYKELMDFVVRLSRDASFYGEQSKLMRQLMQGYSAQNDADQILKVCEETAAMWYKNHQEVRER